MGAGNNGQHSVEEIKQAKDALDKAQKHAASIIDLATQSNPGIDTWGVIGSVIFQPWVEAHLDDTYDYLKQMAECLDDHVTALDTAAGNYKTNEDAMSDALKKIQTAIEDVRPVF
jgi:hypothetical protein